MPRSTLLHPLFVAWLGFSVLAQLQRIWVAARGDGGGTPHDGDAAAVASTRLEDGPAGTTPGGVEAARPVVPDSADSTKRDLSHYTHQSLANCALCDIELTPVMHSDFKSRRPMLLSEWRSEVKVWTLARQAVVSRAWLRPTADLMSKHELDALQAWRRKWREKAAAKRREGVARCDPEEKDFHRFIRTVTLSRTTYVPPVPEHIPSRSRSPTPPPHFRPFPGHTPMPPSAKMGKTDEASKIADELAAIDARLNPPALEREMRAVMRSANTLRNRQLQGLAYRGLEDLGKSLFQYSRGMILRPVEV